MQIFGINNSSSSLQVSSVNRGATTKSDATTKNDATTKSDTIDFADTTFTNKSNVTGKIISFAKSNPLQETFLQPQLKVDIVTYNILGKLPKNYENI